MTQEEANKLLEAIGHIHAKTLPSDEYRDDEICGLTRNEVRTLTYAFTVLIWNAIYLRKDVDLEARERHALQAAIFRK